MPSSATAAGSCWMPPPLNLQQQVVVDQPVVDPDLDARGLVAEEILHQTPRIAPAAPVTLLFQVRELAHDMRVEPRPGDVGHVAALAVVRLLVGDHPDVLQEGITLADGLHGVLIAVRDAERADPVVARAHGHHGHEHLVGTHLLLDEQPVDHLVQRPVAAHDDDPAVAFAHGRDGEFRGVELVLREDRFAEDVGIAQVFRNLWKMVKPATASGHGIDDDEPFSGIGRHAAIIFRERCAACRPGSRRTSRPRRSPPSRRASGGSRSSGRTKSCPARDRRCR